MMTRKDYVEVASILKSYFSNYDYVNVEESRFLVNSFADYFESDNPNFKRDKFKEAVYS